mgnify:CR=1 FL=1
MGTAIKYQLSENLFHLWTDKVHVGLRGCGHICRRDANLILVANACLECNSNPNQHADDCDICPLLHKKNDNSR